MASDRIRACVFDAYGTLFDVHSAVARHAKVLEPHSAEISRLWRIKQLEYSWVCSLMRRHMDFWELTRTALDYALAFYNLHDEQLRDALLESYLVLDAYPEAPATLRALRAAGLKTAVLSNGSPLMLDRAIRSAGLHDLLDERLSIEEVRIYKPDPAAYELATRSFSVQPREVAFFSSNPWDAIGAHTFGFRVFWINRSNQPEEYGLLGKVTVLSSLDDAAARVDIAESDA